MLLEKEKPTSQGPKPVPGRVDPLQVVTDRVTLDEVPQVMARWASDPSSVGKVLVSVSD